MPFPVPPLILSCSPRAGGNSDRAADLAAGVLGAPSPRLREYAVLPCTGCGACSAAARAAPSLDPAPGRAYLGCPLSREDDSAPLLAALLRAPFVLFFSPVYFYHLPAGFKALIDRLQPFWALREAGDSRITVQSARFAGPVFCAARVRGERLFEGSLLTLRYALRPLGLRLREPLLLRGLDAPGDLAANREAEDAVRAYAEDAMRVCVESCARDASSARPGGGASAEIP